MDFYSDMQRNAQAKHFHAKQLWHFSSGGKFNQITSIFLIPAFILKYCILRLIELVLVF